MDKKPGWDAKIIHMIAKNVFGGLIYMFEHHGWPERGSDMFRKVQSRIVETYGSVSAFEMHWPQRNVNANQHQS